MNVTQKLVVLSLILLTIKASTQAQIWTKQGSDIGRAESISLISNGITVAIGVPGSIFSDTGYVQIFKKTYGTWKQVGSDID